MPSLVLGPLLRHVGEHDATIWVEVDGPCEVEVLGHRARTFHVEGHHYGLVVVDGLEPGAPRPYEVALDGERAWPPAESPFPPSTIRTIRDGEPVRVLFGSCRVGYPHEDPYTRSPDEHECGRGHDALHAYARRMLDEPPERWPSALFFVGDQVYADEVSPATLAFIRSRRDTSRPPGEEVADFEEYTHLYREAWSDPVIRWVLSTVSTAMLFDDHDVHDDWNISHGWLEEIRREPWWDERIVGAFVSYWLYQHLGNLSPEQLRRDELFARAHDVDDAGPLLRDFAFRSDRETKGRRWSFCRDLGRTRVLAIDCRAGRVLDPDRRLMVDDEEWDWICDTVEGDFDHLLLAMSDPFLLAPGIHDFQAWNNAVCEGAWGRLAERPAEWLRRTADLDHWASFPRAFDRLANLLREVGSGQRGTAPRTIVALSGDVHNAYLAEVGFPRGSGVTSTVFQAVCSPIRNPLSSLERRGQRFGTTRAATAIGRLLRASARVPPPHVRWRTVRGPTFENQIATLELDDGAAHLRVESPVDRGNGRLELRPVWDYRLAASS